MYDTVPYARSSTTATSARLHNELSEAPSEDELVEKDEIPAEDRVTLTWTNLYVSTKMKGCIKIQPSKPLLRGAEGLVTPCSLMALMGASGAGKTTLLNMLNLRNRQGLDIKGNIMINGHPVNQKDMSETSVFVQQDDIFLGGLKVKEHLSFHANLRMRDSNAAQRKDRVEKVMRQMGLKKCENVSIGVPGLTKGVSGGEAKRLAFGTEILTKPVLIFADEPTSGLDSFMARSLVTLLKSYASSGRTILCTIHQPSSDTFELFDQICIMAEGRCAFIGTTKECMNTFKKAGFPVPNNYNPADHYIFTLAVIPGKEEKCKAHVAALTDAFEKSDTYHALRQDIDELTKHPGSLAFREKRNRVTCSFALSMFLRQFGEIFKRQFLVTKREPQAFLVRLLLAIIMSVLIGSTWFKTDFRELASRQSVPGALFSIVLFVSMSAIMLLIIAIPDNIAVINRDFLNNVYTIGAYYFSIALFFTIEVFITSMIIIHIIFFMVFTDSGREQGAAIDTMKVYPTILGTGLMAALVSIGIGLFVSVNANSFHIATSLASPILTIFMLFSGFLIVVDDIPSYFKFFQYISHYYYAIEIMMGAVYGGLAPPCDPTDKEAAANLTHGFMTLKKLKDMAPKIPPALKPALEFNISFVEKGIKEGLTNACDKVNHPSTKLKCNNYARGDDMLEHFAFTTSHNTRNFCCMFGICLGFHIIAYICFAMKMYKKRK